MQFDMRKAINNNSNNNIATIKVRSYNGDQPVDVNKAHLLPYAFDGILRHGLLI